MIKAGEIQTLRVNRVSDFGLYLTSDGENEVLLPNRYVSLTMKEGDEVEVFIYHDSEDRLVATTKKPLITVMEVAPLKVVDKNVHGAFLDWGIEAKDLFLPNNNMRFPVQIGQYVVVVMYVDNITGRCVATTKLNKYITNDEIFVNYRDEVDLIVAQKSDVGYRVVVNSKNWGVIYNSQIFQSISVGDKVRGFVSKITEENRIDITLQKGGYDGVKEHSQKLLEQLKNSGGSLNVGDNSSPEAILKVCGCSKKVFKRSVGVLLKQKLVSVESERIFLL